jgi:TolA-binding protein
MHARAPVPASAHVTPIARAQEGAPMRAPQAMAARAASPPLAAAALFDEANDARRRGDYARTLTLYHELESRFPHAREALLARATAGKLLLDRGDASGALAYFDSYLSAPGGELREEAMAGRATALERVGREGDARRAWSALLAAFPSTPYAAHAKARLGALDGR